LQVERLRLQGFRSYAALDLALPDGTCAFIGGNAQGKTNLLEAIYLCCVGRSHRTAHDQELVMLGCEQGTVLVDYLNTYGRGSVEMRLQAHGRKQILVNDTSVRRMADLYGHVCCVMFSPEDLALVKQGPSMRRRLVDIALSQAQPAYFHSLQTYNRILTQRNALLKTPRQAPATLFVWDEQLAVAGQDVSERRAVFIEQLSGPAGQLHADIANETLGMAYAPNQPNFSKEAMLEALHQSRGADLARGSTSVGPHRDDIALTVQGRDARVYASQGQQRTVALALKIAELCVLRDCIGQWPLLLLDDVLSELDAKRRHALLTLLPQVQVLVSGTELGGLEQAPVTAFSVANGSISPSFPHQPTV